jgi:CheY-like chemotaxis protein
MYSARSGNGESPYAWSDDLRRLPEINVYMKGTHCHALAFYWQTIIKGCATGSCACWSLSSKWSGRWGNGRSLLEVAPMMKPDVCVIDISMPVISGIEAATQLKESGSTAKIIFLTVHEDSDFVQAALETGALGYVLKSKMASDLRTAVNSAMAGRLFISPACAYNAQADPR